MACKTTPDPAVSVIPQPLQIEQTTGVFTLNSRVKIELPNETKLSGEANYLKTRIQKATGWVLQTVPQTNGKKISLRMEDGLEGTLGLEGYSLTVTKKEIKILATTPAGVFYGIQTLLQLLPPEIYGNQVAEQVKWNVPLVKITDKPRFAWRGYMLDVSRHFFPASYLYGVLDHMAIQKLNVFHLHLADDQGWRLEIKKYPRLTEVGAWRVNREDQHWNKREPIKPGEKADYGGFYTQDDIRKLVAYAGERHITIVPEIEMPAHATAALAAYPEVSCDQAEYSVLPGGIWPCTNIYCAGKDETFTFLENVLSEVMALFPSQYIHIGGDEATKDKWVVCKNCQKRIHEEHLKNEKELQSYFIQRIEKYVNAQGRKIIGWDEILEGGLAPNAAVMSWRGTEGGIAAAKAGHPVVMCPTSNCYIDYYQGKPETQPQGIGGYLPLEKVYALDPVPAGLSAEE